MNRIIENKSNRITTPNKTQYNLVLLLAEKMQLDVSEVKQEQFKVCVENDEVVGFGRVIKKGNLNELATLGVVKSNRNKGISKELVNQLANNKPVFVLTVIPDFFEKLGFNKHKVIPNELKEKIGNRALWDGYGEPYVMFKQKC